MAESLQLTDEAASAMLRRVAAVDGAMRGVAPDECRADYCPVDGYRSAGDIAADADLLRACDMVLAHCHRVVPEVTPYCSNVHLVEHHARRRPGAEEDGSAPERRGDAERSRLHERCRSVDRAGSRLEALPQASREGGPSPDPTPRSTAYARDVALESGVNPKVVQERLGHESIAITLDLYGHVLPSMGKEVAALIGRMLGGG